MCNTVVFRSKGAPLSEQAFTLDFAPSSRLRSYQPTTRLRDLKDSLLLGLGVQVVPGTCMFGDLFSLGKEGDNGLR